MPLLLPVKKHTKYHTDAFISDGWRELPYRFRWQKQARLNGKDESVTKVISLFELHNKDALVIDAHQPLPFHVDPMNLEYMEYLVKALQEHENEESNR